MPKKRPGRREFLKDSLLASGGAAALLSLEERILLAKAPPQSGAPAGSVSGLPMGKIGKLKISRLICGGNLISGFAHSRDLVYVSSLVKRYFTDDKVVETLRICEENGINTAILRLDSHTIRILKRYWKTEGGKIQWIAQIKTGADNLTSDAKKAIDAGAAGLYVQGGVGDSLVKSGRTDVLAKFVEFARTNDAIGGVGGHTLAVPVACEKAGVNPDFYMKTLHTSKYWSFTTENVHDNAWSQTPDKTIEFMKKVDKPWIAFKVLAAGAISPTVGFKHAFTGGADFICVGMFDFQVKDDVKIAKSLLARKLQRQRPWRG